MRFLRNIDFSELKLLNKSKKNKYSSTFRNTIFIRRNLRISILIFSIFIPIFFQQKLLSDISSDKFDIKRNTLKWKKIKIEKQYEKEIIWEKREKNKQNYTTIKEFIKDQEILNNNKNKGITSFNRSIVFHDSIVGPDISWLVPPGFKWNNKYKFDSSLIGNDVFKRTTIS